MNLVGDDLNAWELFAAAAIEAATQQSIYARQAALRPGNASAEAIAEQAAAIADALFAEREKRQFMSHDGES